MPIPLPRLVGAFLAASGVALGGIALGQMVVTGVRGHYDGAGAAFIIVLFGWPVALGAALLAVPVYAVLARRGKVSARAAVGTGAAFGLLVGLIWLGEPLMAVWSPIVGALAGRTWWGVACPRQAMTADVP